MVVCGVPKFLESTQFLLSSSDDHQDSTLRKRKRMISNRESARRSRIRKKKHLGDLMMQVSQLVSDNKHMAINLKDITQMYLNLEYENSILRTQLAELTHQLESLTNIINGFSSLSDNYGTEASIMWRMDDALLVHCDNMLHDNEHFMVEFLN
ncbi:putative transcription factor bZIP family [Helianthus debilis subsp. tardiflorus]